MNGNVSYGIIVIVAWIAFYACYFLGIATLGPLLIALPVLPTIVGLFWYSFQVQQREDGHGRRQKEEPSRIRNEFKVYECPNCGSKQAVEPKSNMVKCKHCRKDYMISI